MREKLVARNAFLETNGKEQIWFSIYSDEKDLERQISHVSRRQPELSEDESVRDLWNQLRDSGEPEIFVVFKGDQALNYLNRQFWWRSYQIHNWQANLLIEEESAGKGQKDKVTDPLELKKNEFLSITYERGPSTLPKLLLSGAVGVYKTPKGLLIRYLQR